MGNEAATTRLRPGMVIAGCWAVEDVLGRGRHAVVYRAEHVVLRYGVAIKMFEPHTSSSDEERANARESFHHEARVARRVHHPNVVRVLEVGATEDATPFLVTELVVGEPLDAHLERELLRVPQAIDLGIQLGAALAGLAEHGIVHQDVRPANVLLGTSALGGIAVKLCDMGLARASDDDDPIDGACVRGSLRYLAPERVRSFGIDARTDVYGAGTSMYEALTGRPPVRGTHPDEILASILADPPLPIRDERSDCPWELEAIIRKALAKRPEDRFACAEDMRAALSALARDLAIPTGAAAWQVPGVPRACAHSYGVSATAAATGRR